MSIFWLIMIKKISILFILSFLSACGRIDFNEAVMLEKQEMPARAAETYEAFADKYPEDAKAPKALLNVAGIYSDIFHLCHKSKPLYERLVRDYPDYPLLSQAKKNIFMCPDYYPLGSKDKWVYGDFQTGGENMRQNVKLLSYNNTAFMMETSFYAGRQFVQKILNIYTFSDEVKAGVFTNCVKVKERERNSPSWVYTYYAPWVGKILTSVAGKNFENRVEELINYEK